ncbi:MYG1 family protein [Salipiger sp. 1_MG-2023]|uniref:MYG1 family protein n=1 Tax=Salipiger sp. 1_MG-2023 TaxID=3062665 RepID=UPI0026E19398|nr:MYG1 family protein [Salipiger sp. 1_MG-2023]MDO6586896.1 MYG1 family protein [Salipiger sp. 1_MG-2023]
MKTTHLVTHSGGFHADELLSSVILTRLFPEATLIRSRDPKWITAAPGRIIYDVGGQYDPAQGVFDHHQRPTPARPSGQPFSSFGLVWTSFGRDYLAALGVPAGDIDAVHASFDDSFVLPIDLMDNGAVDPSSAGPLLARMTLPVLLESLKPVFDDAAPDADDRAFAEALPIARAFVEASIARSAAKLRAAGIVADAIAAAGDGAVLELPMGMPFRSAIEEAGADQLLFVVHPRKVDWALTGIRITENTFEQRADLPAAWAGLSDAALEAACGVPGAKFCHTGRFLAIASSREAALRMAALAVEDAGAQHKA